MGRADLMADHTDIVRLLGYTGTHQVQQVECSSEEEQGMEEEVWSGAGGIHLLCCMIYVGVQIHHSTNITDVI